MADSNYDFQGAPDRAFAAEITRKEGYRSVASLGQSANALVRAVESRASRGRRGRVFAAKFVDDPPLAPAGLAPAGRRPVAEIRIHKLLGRRGCDSIIKYHGMWGPHKRPGTGPIAVLNPDYRVSTWCILLEVADRDLAALVEENKRRNGRGHPVSEGFIWHVLSALAKAVRFLQWKAIVHNDIACRNVFLNFNHDDPYAKYPHVMLGDFGCAGRLSDPQASWLINPLSMKDDLRGMAATAHCMVTGVQISSWSDHPGARVTAPQPLEGIFQAADETDNPLLTTAETNSRDLRILNRTLLRIEADSDRLARERYQPLPRNVVDFCIA